MSSNLIHNSNYTKLIDSASLGRYFFENGTKFGDNICQIDAITGESETYASVKSRSTRLALHLQSLAITANDVIVTCAKNSLNNAIPILAAFYLGTKVGNLDPSLSARQVKHLLAIAQPAVIFLDQSSLNLVETAVKVLNIRPRIINLDRDLPQIVNQTGNEEEFQLPAVDPAGTAVMFFSSGTTGLPKAICHTHKSFIYLLEVSCNDSTTIERILHFTTFYWISGLIIMGAAYLRGHCRIFSGNLPGSTILEAIEKYQVDSIFMSPILTYKLLDAQNAHQYDLSSLKKLVTGGTAISGAHLKRLQETFPNASVLFGYGMSECGIISKFDPDDHQTFIKTKLASCGKLAAGITLKIVDPKSGTQLGCNRKGEICVKTGALMEQYYNSDAALPLDEEGFLRTGDAGYYDEDECLYVVERLKEVFKYLSWHIVPAAIEAVILEHPAVEETAVFGVPLADEAEGEAPAAGVVVKANAAVTRKEIEEFVAERVADTERLRGGVYFLRELPRTPTGKLVRREVRSWVLAQAAFIRN